MVDVVINDRPDCTNALSLSEIEKIEEDHKKKEAEEEAKDHRETMPLGPFWPKRKDESLDLFRKKAELKLGDTFEVAYSCGEVIKMELTTKGGRYQWKF